MKTIETREQAETEISEQGYNGFATKEKWYCVSHAIDEVLSGEWEALLAFAQGETTELPDGITDAWHDGSMQYLSSSRDLPWGIYCDFMRDGEDCGAEIYPADSVEVVPTVKFEWDLTFVGGESEGEEGNYSDQGAFVPVPASMIDEKDEKGAFEAFTGFSRINIIHWDGEENDEELTHEDLIDEVKDCRALLRDHISSCVPCQQVQKGISGQ